MRILKYLRDAQNVLMHISWNISITCTWVANPVDTSSGVVLEVELNVSIDFVYL